MPLDQPIVEHLPSVQGALTYLAKMTERARTYTYDPGPCIPRSNLEYDTHTMPIHDMRPVAHAVSLDREGFALVESNTTARDLYDEAELRSVYYPEAEKLLASVTGGNRVVVFDHTIRRRTPGVEDRTPGIPRLPVARIHGDYTETSGPQRVRDLMGAEAATLLRHRFAIVNVWRPIRGPLRDAPLAVCDAQTVAPGDWVLGDADGVVVVPADRADAVFRAALDKIAAEDTTRAELEAGDSLRAVFARHGVL